MTKELTQENLNKLIAELDEAEMKLFNALKVKRKFIQNLITTREEKGMTIEDLAEKAGMTITSAYKFEKMDLDSCTDDLIKYLLALDIDINKLFE